MDDTTNTENVENKEKDNVDTTEQKETETKKRLEREKSKMPPKEDLEAFKEWKKSQQTEQEKLAEERKEFESVKSELARLKNEKEVLKQGIDSKYADYVTFEVSKLDGDFAENLSEFIKSNQQFVKGTQSTTPTQAGGQKVKNETGKVDYSQMSDAEYYKAMKKKQ